MFSCVAGTDYQDQSGQLVGNMCKISPLALAAQHGQYAVMVDFFRRGANIHYIQRGTKKTILHFACENGKKEIIDFCFRNHVPLNALDHMKRTPLITYVEMGLAPENAVETLNHLIKIGADVTSKDKDNYTALHYACKTINLSNTDIKRKIISVLIRAGCVSNNATLSKRTIKLIRTMILHFVFCFTMMSLL